MEDIVQIFFTNVDTSYHPGLSLCRLDAGSRYSTDFPECLYSWMKYVPRKVCWVWYAGEVSWRGCLVWGGERVGVGRGS